MAFRVRRILGWSVVGIGLAAAIGWSFRPQAELVDLETVTRGGTTQLEKYDYVLLPDGRRDYVIETDDAGVNTKIDWEEMLQTRSEGKSRYEACQHQGQHIHGSAARCPKLKQD